MHKYEIHTGIIFLSLIFEAELEMYRNLSSESLRFDEGQWYVKSVVMDNTHQSDNSSQSYEASPNMCDHSVLPSTQKT